MTRSLLLSVSLVLLASLPRAAAAPPAPAPPARPSEDSVQEAGRKLLDAIVHDDPKLAEGVFFPRSAFVQVKAMQKPERYYDKLHARFLRDLHALHLSLPTAEGFTFVKLALGRRGGWVKPNEEGNRLPYWAARHAVLHYRAGASPRTLEVRVLITWEGRWFVIHLSEFQS